MNITSLLDPTDIRDYAKALGWTPLVEALKDRLYVLNHPSDIKRQIVFPMDTSAPDYLDAIQIAVEKLSDLNKISSNALVNQILTIREDTVRYRVITDLTEDFSVPLSFAATMLQGAQNMLLSAAHSVLKPQSYHPRLSKTEAQQLIDESRFRHTEHGSFVVKVSCPIQAVREGIPKQLSFESEAKIPFVRRATMALFQGVKDLVTAIEADQQDALIERAKSSDGTPLSANLCEALLRFQDARIRNSLELGIDWSPLIKPPASLGNTVRIQRDYFPRIDEVRQALRPDEVPRTDTFIGTVERLDGEMGAGGKRLGEVMLALLLPEGESVRTRVHLNAEQYEHADQAHMTDGAYIQIKGTLHPGRSVRTLDSVQEFRLIHPTTSQ
jgi:hypothetical protein